MRLGVLSDTHGLLRPEVLEELADCDRILHAGDIGSTAVLEGLQRVAPLDAVRGNVDDGPWAASLPEYLALEFEGVKLLMFHGHLPPPESEEQRATVLIRGHSHRPELRWSGGKLDMNPGSAGRKRFSLPVSLAMLTLRDGRIEPELIDLSSARGL